MADGTKLPSLIIFKLKKIPCENFLSEVVVQANQTDWMNKQEMMYWIEKIWTKRAPRFLNSQSLLVLDRILWILLKDGSLKKALTLQLFLGN